MQKEKDPSHEDNAHIKAIASKFRKTPHSSSQGPAARGGAPPTTLESTHRMHKKSNSELNLNAEANLAHTPRETKQFNGNYSSNHQGKLFHQIHNHEKNLAHSRSKSTHLLDANA